MNGNRKLLPAVLLAAALLAAGGGIARAADPARPDLALSTEVRKAVVVKDARGEERTEWREARDIRPGDTLKYTVSYRNAGKAEARDARVENAVPKETAYVSGSAEGNDASVTFSVGGKTFQEPPRVRYRVRSVDGTETEFLATPEMYTHIRWTLHRPVPPGGSGSVSFQVRVR